MSRDVDIQCATALGWTDIRDDYYRLPESIWYGKPPVMPSWESPDHKAKGITLLPHYSTSIVAAWQLVEFATRIPQTREEAIRMVNTRFGYWFDGAHLWACSAEEAAAEICSAFLRILEESRQ